MQQKQGAYVALLIMAATSGILSWKFLGTYVVNNEKAQDVLVNLFSILAGFIIAIMTLLGDAGLRTSVWKKTRFDADASRRRLDRQQYLFWLYLVTLSVILMGRLLQSKMPALSADVQRVGFGLATTSLILSFALPVALRGAQVARMDAAVEKAKDSSSRLGRS